jgi:hypothetical protein
MTLRLRLGLRMSFALCLLGIIWPGRTFELPQQEQPVNWVSESVVTLF